MKKKVLKLFWLGLGSAFVCGLGGIAILAYFSFTLPKISTLADYRPALPSKILAKDGTVLATIGIEKRDIADFDEIPKIIVDSFLSAEDDGFYEHQGVDYLGLLRAFVVNLKAGRVVQGGSTITQQVAKSLLLTRERSITRKIKDFLLAQRIEKKFSKEEILYLYLNQVYLGGGYYGVKSALRGYFGKNIADATIAEAAMIAGLLVAPGKYSPYINPERAKTRQHYVLKRLKETGKITEEQYTQAIEEKTQYKMKLSGSFKAGYFTEWVRQRVVKLLGEEEFLTGGYKVSTTIDLTLQEKAEEEVYQGAKEIDKRQGYKGSIGKVDLENLEEIRAADLKTRTDAFRDESTYFTINSDLQKSYEFEYDESEYQKIIDHLNTKPNVFEKMNIEMGYLEDDSFFTYLKKGESYKARVLELDNIKRAIFVSIAGITGIIPYDDFKWAHERVITENRHSFQYITRPTQILKKGDVVLVSIKDKVANYEELLNIKPGELKLKKSMMRLLKKQKYLHCGLDQEPEVQAALVSMDPVTGEILSLVGGTNFQKSKYNRAVQSKRQPGSSFKPLLFAAGLEKGFYPNSIIIDSPESLGGGDEQVNWKPKNYDGKFKGPVTFRNSLEQSRNIPTIKIANQVGVNYILNFVQRIGFKAEMAKDLSLALGSFGSTLLDLVSAYATFPSGGVIAQARSVINVTDREGNVFLIKENENELEKVNIFLPEQTEVESVKEQSLVDATPTPTGTEEPKISLKSMFVERLNDKQVYDRRLAYIMSNLLKGVVLHGTGRGARSVSQFIGGKTGTTSDYIDAWFLGFSSNIVTGVWTGFDNNTTMGWGETGSKSALPIWKSYMSKALSLYGEKDFQVPAGIINVLIDKETGKLAKEDDENSFMEAFVDGTEPGGETSKILNQGNSNPTDLVGDDDYYDNQ